ncbi:MAG: hypothetical protein LBK95_11075 [Bifidobacteriaceae bacterium]|nr:hypothetical protein [Bifidobacteriaceae bacterium]
MSSQTTSRPVDARRLEDALLAALPGWREADRHALAEAIRQDSGRAMRAWAARGEIAPPPHEIQMGLLQQVVEVLTAATQAPASIHECTPNQNKGGAL